ncbi:hypothetical protein ACQEVY_11285 [Streptomyces sp. CA-288835]|uniref:hypothetical protein n=1 Tax=Streptomyces sp. CA-288835 TaxID=3240069 RepID=UPI003D8FDB25
MTSDDSSLFSPPGAPGYAEADSSFPLAAPVNPARAFTARSIDDVVRAAARRAGRPLLLNTPATVPWPGLTTGPSACSWTPVPSFALKKAVQIQTTRGKGGVVACADHAGRDAQ